MGLERRADRALQVGSHLMPLALSYNAVEGMWFLGTQPPEHSAKSV